MEFKQWLLLQEKAERTSSKVPLYPVLYHTKQYLPLYHTMAAADYPYWLHAKLEPYTWQNFQRAFGHEQIPKPNWPKVGSDLAAHAASIPHPKTWKIPD